MSTRNMLLSIILLFLLTFSVSYALSEIGGISDGATIEIIRAKPLLNIVDAGIIVTGSIITSIILVKKWKKNTKSYQPLAVPYSP